MFGVCMYRNFAKKKTVFFLRQGEHGYATQILWLFVSKLVFGKSNINVLIGSHGVHIFQG